MVKVVPPGNRAQVQDSLQSLLISIPAKRSWFILIFLSFWLAGWFFGEITALTQLLSVTSGETGVSDKAPELGFVLFWLAGWTVGGVFAVAIWLWNLSGRELIDVSPAGLLLRYDVMGLGYTREYDVSAVKNVRVAPELFSRFAINANFKLWGIGGGPIAFDYGSSTVRFGAALDEAEAAKIVGQLSARLGQMVPVV